MLNKIKSAVYESSDEYDEEELQSIYNVHTSRKELHRNGQTKMRSKIEHHPERASPKWPNPNAIQNRALAGMSFIRTYLAGNKPPRASLSPPAGPRKEPKRQAPARIHGAGGGGGTQQRGFAAAAASEAGNGSRRKCFAPTERGSGKIGWIPAHMEELGSRMRDP